MKLESTVRYLGIEVEDALAMAEQTDIDGVATLDGCLNAPFSWSASFGRLAAGTAYRS
jgi:hypothetical protein